MSVRILHIGTGDRGRNWLEYVRDHPGTTSVACVEPGTDSLRKAQELLGGAAVRTFSELAPALREVEADAALITSPSALHTEHALAALDGGLAVMIEKPFALSVADAQRVIAKGREVQRPVMVAENFRFVPVERTIRKMVSDGLFGELTNATLIDRRRMPRSMQGAWAGDLEYVHMQEIAVHHFDSLRSYFGRKPIAIAARAWNPAGSDYRHGACTEALIELEHGLHVQYLGTLNSNKFAYRLTIEGTGGTLWTNRKLILWRPAGKKFFLPHKQVAVPQGDAAAYPREGTTSLLDNLVAALAGKQAETSGDDNLWTIAMLEAGKRSDRERRTVDIAEVLAAGA